MPGKGCILNIWQASQGQGFVFILFTADSRVQNLTCSIYCSICHIQYLWNVRGVSLRKLHFIDLTFFLSEYVEIMNILNAFSRVQYFYFNITYAIEGVGNGNH